MFHEKVMILNLMTGFMKFRISFGDYLISGKACPLKFICWRNRGFRENDRK